MIRWDCTVGPGSDSFVLTANSVYRLLWLLLSLRRRRSQGAVACCDLDFEYLTGEFACSMLPSDRRLTGWIEQIRRNELVLSCFLWGVNESAGRAEDVRCGRILYSERASVAIGATRLYPRSDAMLCPGAPSTFPGLCLTAYLDCSPPRLSFTFYYPRTPFLFFWLRPATPSIARRTRDSRYRHSPPFLSPNLSRQ